MTKRERKKPIKVLIPGRAYHFKYEHWDLKFLVLKRRYIISDEGDRRYTYEIKVIKDNYRGGKSVIWRKGNIINTLPMNEGQIKHIEEIPKEEWVLEMM